eukprot:TRINITY_DN84967_c0_g1_i1.p1 TRINITY_DN84967_c0_g1~~TRINITY_DN84967_c0_g1_i1.p1  ORF type:complete len:128 (+),score=12.32 TRINITY_DN84967_c0_g1_i1:94-477(+)
MNSVHFQKNPVLGQIYWAEVIKKEERGHVFHRSRHSKPIYDRSFPTSTHQSTFRGSQGLGLILEQRELPIPAGGPGMGEHRVHPSLRHVGRTALTPRSTGQSFERSAMLSSGYTRLLTPGSRPPAGA